MGSRQFSVFSRRSAVPPTNGLRPLTPPRGEWFKKPARLPLKGSDKKSSSAGLAGVAEGGFDGELYAFAQDRQFDDLEGGLLNDPYPEI